LSPEETVIGTPGLLKWLSLEVSVEDSLPPHELEFACAAA
jgi:hypothetical protein